MFFPHISNFFVVVSPKYLRWAPQKLSVKEDRKLKKIARHWARCL